MCCNLYPRFIRFILVQEIASAPCGLANHSSDQTEELKLFMESDSFYLLESL